MATGAFKPSATKAAAWWNLTPNQKVALQRRRLGGEFGGEGAAGVGKAPYFWSQEYGNPAAQIKAQRFASRAWNNFYARAHDILMDAVDRSFKSA